MMIKLVQRTDCRTDVAADGSAFRAGHVFTAAGQLVAIFQQASTIRTASET